MRRKYVLAAGSAALGVLGVLFYFGVLVTFSLASREQEVALDGEKYFCAADCHLAYSVVELRKASTLGPPATPSAAGGSYYVVRIRVRFDEQTTAPWRPKGAPLSPAPRTFTLITDDGRCYAPSQKGQRALEAAEGQQTWVETPLQPSESFTTALVFEAPAELKNPRLLIVDSEWFTYLLIGHENTFLHKKTFFRLG